MMIVSSRKQILFASALMLFLALSGCRKAATTNEQAPAGSGDAERVHPESGVTSPVETRFFKGSIGNALDLQMKLVRDGDKLTGSYFYQKVGTKIDLRGTIDEGGNVVLQEFDPAGKQTGLFTGLWKQNSDGVIAISGNWTKPNSDKKTAFALLQEPIEFANGVEIVAKQIKEKNKKLKYEVDVAYPQLTGSVDPNYEKFNQTIRSLINRKVSEFKKEMTPTAADELTPEESPAPEESSGSDITIGYEVALAKDDLVDIEFTVSSYSAGAAHPNSYTEVVNFDLKNGKSLKLADLFSPGAKYLQTLSTYCIQDLKKQAKEQGQDAMVDDDWIKRGAGAELTNYDNWTITRKGLGITFDPYQVASYAAGPQSVVVPYSALKEIIKLDGPAGQFVK
jgi:hypothetical protein